MGDQQNQDAADRALLADLRAALAGTREQVEAVAARGKASFGWRTIDEDLLFAGLTFDSGLETGLESGLDSDLVGATRSPSNRPNLPRILEFTAALEIHVFADHVQGSIDPPGQVVVEWADGQISNAEMGPMGSFRVSPVPTGVFRFRSGARPVQDSASEATGSRPAEGHNAGRVVAASIVTDWITL